MIMKYSLRVFLLLLLCIQLQSVKAQPVSSGALSLKAAPVFPIPVEKMVMYEVFVRNFSKAGDFKSVTWRLTDIKALGVNIIWLMPIQPTGIENKKGTYGSPYAIKDYTAVNPD